MKNIISNKKIIVVFSLLIIVSGTLYSIMFLRPDRSSIVNPVSVNKTTSVPKGTTTDKSTLGPKAATQATPVDKAPTSTTNATNTEQTATLLAPTGSFSNVYTAHTNDQMGSTCNTTANASCTITFTNGNQTFSLPSQTTNGAGDTFWAWKPSQISLTPGTWHIVAYAKLGQQSKETSNDPLTLKIL